MTKLVVITVVASIIGGICSILIVPWESLTFEYAAWNLWPYILVVALAIAQPRFVLVWLGMGGVMAIGDIWVLGETFLNTTSDLLMAIGLLVALKPFALLPVGAVLGWILHRIKSRNARSQV